jgi:uncharacterized protein (DUF433 family)
MKTQEKKTYPPVTGEELDAWEARECGSDDRAGEDVARLIVEVRRLRRRLGPPRIVRTPGVCGGDPTVGETRICVRHVIALAPHYDWDLETLREQEFPDLSPEEIRLAVAYYREYADEIDESLRRNRSAKEQSPALAGCG